MVDARHIRMFPALVFITLAALVAGLTVSIGLWKLGLGGTRPGDVGILTPLGLTVLFAWGAREWWKWGVGAGA